MTIVDNTPAPVIGTYPATRDDTLRVTKPVAFWIALAVVILGFLYLVRGILLPFVMAAAVAYFFDPLVRRMQRHGLPRWQSAMIVLLAFVILFAGALFLIVPVLEEQIEQLISAVPHWIQSIKTEVLPRIDAYASRMGFGDQAQLNSSTSSAAEKALSTVGTVLGGVLTGGLAVIDLLSLLLVTPIVAFYLLRDWDQVVHDGDLCFPRRHAAALRQLFRDIDRTLSGFIRGQALVCLIQATYYGVVLTVCGLDFGALVGVAAGILTFIPYLGAAIGLITALLIALAEWHDGFNVAKIAAVFVFGMAMEGNLITPKLVGDRIGLHPAWVIFAVLAGGALFGFLGTLLAVPVAAVIGVLIRFGMQVYLTSRIYEGDAAGNVVGDAAHLR